MDYSPSELTSGASTKREQDPCRPFYNPHVKPKLATVIVASNIPDGEHSSDAALGLLST